MIMRLRDRFSRQRPSEAAAPSGTFGLIEEPGTINQTDKQPGGLFQFRMGAHKSAMSLLAS